MTLAYDLRGLARSIRSIPGKLGLRPHRAWLTVRSWDGDRLGDGSYLDSEIEIVEADGQPPKIRQLNDERLALTGLAAGSIEIGPITSDWEGYGLTAGQLRGLSNETGTDAQHIRISGPTGNAYYSIKQLKLDRAIHWMIVASPVGHADTQP